MKNGSGGLKSCYSFECFLLRRFLDFYNNRNSSSFICLEKKDEKNRNSKSYDYRCLNQHPENEMRIEVKRLISEEQRHSERSIEKWFEKNITVNTRNSIRGKYIVALWHKQNNKERLNNKKLNKLFGGLIVEVKDAIKKLGESDYVDLKQNEATLIKVSDGGYGDINPWVFLDQRKDRGSLEKIRGLKRNPRALYMSKTQLERIRKLEHAATQFPAKEKDSFLNVVLIIGKGKRISANELKHIHKFLGKEKCGMDIIDEVYFIGLSRKPCIIQAYPDAGMINATLFNPQHFMSDETFRSKCIEY